MEFKDILKEYRNSLGLTQEGFASKFGLSRVTIAKFESGERKPSLKSIENLACKTGTEISFWLGEGKNIKVEQFMGMRMVFDALIESGDLTPDKVTEEGINMICKMAVQEGKLYAERKQKN